MWKYFKKNILGWKCFIAQDSKGNKYFEQQLARNMRSSRTVDLVQPEFKVTDLPYAWRLWLYHRIQRPPVDYEDEFSAGGTPESYKPPIIDPEYQPKNSELVSQVIQKLSKQDDIWERKDRR